MSGDTCTSHDLDVGQEKESYWCLVGKDQGSY